MCMTLACLSRCVEMLRSIQTIMVNAEKLSVARGQLGPKCAMCGEPMSFGEALVIDSEYYCQSCYEKITGAVSSSEPKEVAGLRMD